VGLVPVETSLEVKEKIKINESEEDDGLNEERPEIDL